MTTTTNQPTAAQPINIEPAARVDRIISASGLAEVSVFLESALKVGTVFYAAAAHAAAAPSAEQAPAAARRAAERINAMHKGVVSVLSEIRAEHETGTTTKTEQPPSGNTGEVAPHAPAGWREFIESCAQASGGMINGNFLSMKARDLLAAAPAAPHAQAEPVARLQAAYDSLRFYVDASERELDECGISRDGALRLARNAEAKLSAPVPQEAEQAATAAVTDAVQGETAAQVGAGDLPPYEVVAAVNSLRWMLNKSDECDKPNMRATTLLDKHHSKDGKTIRQDLEILWRYFDANRPEMTALLLSGADRAAAPALTDAARDVLADVCDLPPKGWHCTREPGHDGPCAAWPEGDANA